jgi:hypothetical protein
LAGTHETAAGSRVILLDGKTLAGWAQRKGRAG